VFAAKNKCGASSGHITEIKQSIFSFDIYDYNLATTEARVKSTDLKSA
jgi:hypothetical protein